MTRKKNTKNMHFFNVQKIYALLEFFLDYKMNKEGKC